MPLIARVLLPLPLPEAFDYAAPEEMTLAVGDQVSAPLGPRQVRGVVVELRDGHGVNRPLKPLAAKLDEAPLPPGTLAFVQWAARYACEPRRRGAGAGAARPARRAADAPASGGGDRRGACALHAGARARAGRLSGARTGARRGCRSVAYERAGPGRRRVDGRGQGPDRGGRAGAVRAALRAGLPRSRPLTPRRRAEPQPGGGGPGVVRSDRRRRIPGGAPGRGYGVGQD